MEKTHIVFLSTAIIPFIIESTTNLLAQKIILLKCLSIAALALLIVQPATARTFSIVDSSRSKKMPGTSAWGEINSGNSNYGILGQVTINYRVNDRFVSAGIYKSHLCYAGEYDGLSFPDTRLCETHVTIVSYSLSGGIILPGKLCPSVSCGISIGQFTYKHTAPETDILSLSSVWATVAGSDGMDNVLRTQVVTAVGVPVEFRLHLAQRHFIGFDAGVKIDINMQRSMMALQLGLRLGKVTKMITQIDIL